VPRERASSTIVAAVLGSLVEAYGLRSLLFELLVVNPRLLELLVKTFDASQSGGALLIRRPHLVEDITRGGMLDQSLDVDRHLERLRSLGVAAENLDPVRAYRQTESLRILWRDLLQLAPFPILLAEQSALAEACLVHLDEIVNRVATLTIIALGKFGGREITYGADLDLLFVGEDVRAAQNLMVANALPSAEGSLASLDARLRPEGEKGPLVCSLSSYRDYYAARAQLWELQTLTRARGIRGPLQIDFIALAQEAWRQAGRREDLFRQIDNMLKRISGERGSSQDFLELKTGRGGIIAAEFLVQALQMRNDVREPSVRLAIMKLAGIISSEDVDLLGRHYEFLRQLETVLRRRRNISVSSLPADPTEQRKLAIGMEFKDRETWQEQCERARADIHGIYDKYFRWTS
jgi:glutamate-ammonia-ligase adenylyltransferase